MDIRVFVDSANSSSEQRISLLWTIATLKEKLWPITGIPPQNQVLADKQADDSASIADLGLQDLSTLKILDSRPAGQRENFTDVSNVDKFEISQEEYEDRQDTVLAYKRRNKLGRFDPQAAATAQSNEDHEAECAERLQAAIGQRCRIKDTQNHGTLRFIGTVPEIPRPGLWAGIEYDEPIGKHDGSIKQRAYFSCLQHHGAFVKPSRIEIGNYAIQLDQELLSSGDEI